MPITVPYLEMHEGNSETIAVGNVTAVKRYLIAWSDRWQFAKDVAGTAQKIGSGLSTITRYVPLQYPGNKNLYANGLKMEPTGRSSCDSQGNSVYTHCICEVSFSTLSWDYELTQDNPGKYDQPYKTLSISMTADFMTLPSRPFVFNTLVGGQQVQANESPGLLMPKAEITLVSHQLPDIDLNGVFTKIGTINDATFYDAPRGTLLFMGANQNRQRMDTGSKAWEVEYKFVFRPVDWNKFYSPAKGVGFDFLKDKQTGNYIYQYSDFTQLP